MNDQTIRFNYECPKEHAANEKQNRDKGDSDSFFPTGSTPPRLRTRRPAYFLVKSEYQQTHNANGNKDGYDLVGLHKESESKSQESEFRDSQSQCRALITRWDRPVVFDA